MTNKEALVKLESLGRDRPWLCEATGYSINSLYNVFSGDVRELNDRMTKAFERAFSEEERRRDVDTTKPGASIWDLVYFSGSEVEKIDRARKIGGYPALPAMYRDAVIQFADKLIDGEKKSVPITAAPKPEPIQLHRLFTTLPFHGSVAAGTPAATIDDLTDDTLNVKGQWPAGHFALRVSGQSMEPDYPDGSTIICRPLKSGEYAKKGDDVVCADAAGSYFKRLIYSKDGPKTDSPRKAKPHLASINPAFPDVIPASDCPIRAVVVGKD